MLWNRRWPPHWLTIVCSAQQRDGGSAPRAALNGRSADW
jgi:hypothetical protein